MKRLRLPREHVVSLAIAVAIVALISVSAHILKPATPTTVFSPEPTPSAVPVLHDSTDVIAPTQ